MMIKKNNCWIENLICETLKSLTVFHQLKSLGLTIPFLGLTLCFVVFSLLLALFGFARVQLWLRRQVHQRKLNFIIQSSWLHVRQGSVGSLSAAHKVQAVLPLHVCV